MRMSFLSGVFARDGKSTILIRLGMEPFLRQRDGCVSNGPVEAIRYCPGDSDGSFGIAPVKQAQGHC